jgi:hypothetical protein
MKKLMFGLLLGLIALTMLVTACGKTISVAGNPPYSAMLGKEYILQRDCYVFRWLDEKKALELTPTGLDTRGSEGIPPQESIDFGLIGKRVDRIEIVDVLPKNTVVKVVDVKHAIYFEDEYYKIFVETEINGLRQVYGAIPLQEVYYGKAAFDPRFIVEKQK